MDLVQLWLPNFVKYHGWLVAMLDFFVKKKKKMSPRGSELCGLADLRWLSWKVRSEFFLSCLKAFKQVLIILSSSKNAVSDKYVVSSECFQATAFFEELRIVKTCLNAFRQLKQNSLQTFQLNHLKSAFLYLSPA